MKLVHAILYFLKPQNPLRWLQRAGLEVALKLQRLDHPLFEILEDLTLPFDVAKMRDNRVPRTVVAELYGTVDTVRREYLGEAIPTW